MNLHQHHQSLFFFVSWIFSWKSRRSPLWLFRHNDGWLWYREIVFENAGQGCLHPALHTQTQGHWHLSPQMHTMTCLLLILSGGKKLVWRPLYVSVSCEPSVPESQKHISTYFFKVENCSSTARFIKSNFLVLQKKLWPR